MEEKKILNVQDKVGIVLLGGGKSERMGEDKTMMTYHDGMPQIQYLYSLCRQFSDKVKISCKPDLVEIYRKYGPCLPDVPGQRGPISGIINALKSHDTAWLVLACDLPLINSASIQQIIAVRDPLKMATVYTNENGLPEPLFGIWEQNSLIVLEQAVSDNKGCPRKLLIHHSERVKLCTPLSYDYIFNANHPEEAALALQKIKGPAS